MLSFDGSRSPDPVPNAFGIGTGLACAYDAQPKGCGYNIWMQCIIVF